MTPKRRGPATKNDVALARVAERTHVRLIDRGAGVFRTALRWTGTFLVAHEAKGAIEAMVAGKIAFGAILMSMISGRAERWILVGTTAICAAFAYRERRFRRRVTRSQGERIRALEAQRDPGRSSSRLPSDGRPDRKEDDDEP
jgi:hypothetical protein